MATKDRTTLKDEFKNGNLATGEKFADLIDSMKVVQLPVVDPQALGTSLSFIDSISQDADGKITATKKTLDLANAHELNPFKGWYKTGDTLPTDGFDGAYLYFKDTTQSPVITTIYQWNGTAYADTGTEVDESYVNTFGSGQALNAVKIKDADGDDDPNAQGVLSAEAGKEINDRFTTEPIALTPEFSNNGFWKPDKTYHENSSYRTSVPISVDGVYAIVLSCLNNSTVSPCVFLSDDENIDANCVYAEPKASPDPLSGKIIPVPPTAHYVAFSRVDSKTAADAFSASAIGIKEILTQDEIKFQTNQKLSETSITDSIESNDNDIPNVKAVNDALGNLPLYLEQIDAFTLSFSNTGFWTPDKTHNTTNTSYRTTNPIDIENYDYVILTCPSNNLISPCVFLDSNNACVYAVAVATSGLTNEKIAIPKNLNPKYVVFSCVNTSSVIAGFVASGMAKIPIANAIGSKACYMSVNGSDLNDGLSAEHPVATFAKAKQITTDTLYILEGVYDYADGYDFDLSAFDKVIGIGNVIFMRYQAKIASADLVSGKTKVYQAQIPTLAMEPTFIWQHGIPSMPIAQSEYHPLQNNREYRLPSTRMYPVSTIDEIENATDGIPRFYADRTNDILYFSKVTDSNLSNNPIIIPSTATRCYKGTSRKNVSIQNINFMYAGVKTENIAGEFVACSAGMCESSAFLLTDTVNITLKKCEGYAGHTLNSGDGFSTGAPTNDEFTKIIMYDCWGHDNRDDGESTHGNVSVVQYGGLYEYNGNGCTPASGANGEYHSVLCRNNSNSLDWVFDEGNTRAAFSAQGKLSGSNVIYATMFCFNCVAEGSNIGFQDTNPNSSSHCYNCIAIDCDTDYRNISPITS